MTVKIIGHEQRSAGGARLCDHGVGITERRCDRFFVEDVLFGAQAQLGGPAVHVVRHGQNNRLHARIGESCLETVKTPAARSERGRRAIFRGSRPQTNNRTSGSAGNVVIARNHLLGCSFCPRRFSWQINPEECTYEIFPFIFFSYRAIQCPLSTSGPLRRANRICTRTDGKMSWIAQHPARQARACCNCSGRAYLQASAHGYILQEVPGLCRPFLYSLNKNKNPNTAQRDRRQV